MNVSCLAAQTVNGPASEGNIRARGTLISNQSPNHLKPGRSFISRARNSTALRTPAIQPGVKYDVYSRTCDIHPASSRYLPCPVCRRSNPSDSTPRHNTRGYRRPSNVPILARLSASGSGSAAARSSASASTGMRAAASILLIFLHRHARIPGWCPADPLSGQPLVQFGYHPVPFFRRCHCHPGKQTPCLHAAIVSDALPGLKSDSTGA